jgi:hypothetical protein
LGQRKRGAERQKYGQIKWIGKDYRKLGEVDKGMIVYMPE